MNDYINFTQSTILVLKGIVNTLWMVNATVVSIAIVIGCILILYWYPLSYLSEGDQYHEKKFAEYLRLHGFDHARRLDVEIPENRFRDFQTSCSAWISSDEGKTFGFIELKYFYKRKGWLDGISQCVPFDDQTLNPQTPNED